MPLRGISSSSRLTGHVLHGDEVDAVGLVDVIDRDDVRVIERRRCLRFLDEAALSLRVGNPFGCRVLIATKRSR